jgi:uncharacterized protein (DUF2267 family)
VQPQFQEYRIVWGFLDGSVTADAQFWFTQLPVVLGGRYLDDASQGQGRVDLQQEEFLDRVEKDEGNAE